MDASIRSMEWVSDKTGIPINSLRYYRAQGIGPKSFKLGRRVVYDVADVEAWIAEARAAGSADAK
jgi:predicted DNA-binding transcriptional regulator AlpA